MKRRNLESIGNACEIRSGQCMSQLLDNSPGIMDFHTKGSFSVARFRQSFLGWVTMPWSHEQKHIANVCISFRSAIGHVDHLKPTEFHQNLRILRSWNGYYSNCELGQFLGWSVGDGVDSKHKLCILIAATWSTSSTTSQTKIPMGFLWNREGRTHDWTCGVIQTFRFFEAKMYLKSGRPLSESRSGCCWNFWTATWSWEFSEFMTLNTSAPELKWYLDFGFHFGYILVRFGLLNAPK